MPIPSSQAAAGPGAGAALQRLLWREPWASPLAVRAAAQQHHHQQHLARFASDAKPGSGDADADADAAAASSSKGGEAGDEAAGSSGDEAPTVEQLTAELQEREKAVEELQAKVRGF